MQKSDTSALSYQTLMDRLNSDIISQATPGDKLPGIRALCKNFNVCQVTVERALFELETQGLIYKKARSGTYVSEAIESSESCKGTVALVVPQTLRESSFYNDIIHGVEDALFEYGYQMILCRSYEDVKRGEEHIRRLLFQDTNGIILVCSGGLANKSLVKELSKKKTVVVVDGAIDDIQSDYITTDDFNGAYQAVEYHINKGHKKIALITSGQELTTMKNRYSGYKKALADHGIPLNEDLLREMPSFSINDGAAGIKSLLEQADVPTALFATSDSLLRGVLNECFREKMKIPEDLSIIGFGGLEFENPYELKHSYVRQPAYDMGKKAVELIDSKVTGAIPKGNCREVILPVKLEIRDS